MNFICNSSSRQPTRFHLTLLTLRIILASGLGLSLPVRANVYPTNLRVNGSTTNVTAAGGANVLISYLLNEPASGGVTVVIKSNATTLRTLSLLGGGDGTARGTNAVVWDGKNDGSNNVAPGLYSVQVTASATGHADWTQISNDGDAGNYAYAPVSIAVNRNPNSP